MLSFFKQKSIKKEFYRKSVHLSSLWIPTLMFFMPMHAIIYILALLLVLDLAAEYANYKKYFWFRRMTGKLFSQTLRIKELKRNKFTLSGAFYVLCAALLCCFLFPKNICIIALSIMIVSDACAAIIGKCFGTRKIRKQKSLEGCTAFFVSALVIMLLFNPIFNVRDVSIIACMVATIAELFEDKLRLDDNLSIPLLIGCILYFA